MRDTGLPARIRAKAVPVELVAGWETRGRDGGGYPDFEPIGALLHHTAGGANGTIPSLATLIYGRPDVEGPLSQVGQSREANHVDKAYVIAAGKANHGGVGTWSGPAGTMNSNYESEGLEVEHVGTGPVHPARLETAARIIAAMLEVRPGLTAAMACTHYEYALPAGRKIDFYNLDPPFNQPSKAAEFRARVAYWIGRRTTRPVDPNNPWAPAVSPAPPTPIGLDMATFFFRAPGKEWRLYDGGVLIDLPYESSSAVANEFIKTADLATKHLTGKIIYRRDVSPALYAYITAAAQSKASDAPGFVAKIGETGKQVWVAADRTGKISQEHSPDDFAAIVWVVTSQGFDLTPQPYAAEQLDGIPELSTEAPEQAGQPNV